MVNMGIFFFSTNALFLRMRSAQQSVKRISADRLDFRADDA